MHRFAYDRRKVRMPGVKADNNWYTSNSEYGKSPERKKVYGPGLPAISHAKRSKDNAFPDLDYAKQLPGSKVSNRSVFSVQSEASKENNVAGVGAEKNSRSNSRHIRSLGMKLPALDAQYLEASRERSLHSWQLDHQNRADPKNWPDAAKEIVHGRANMKTAAAKRFMENTCGRMWRNMISLKEEEEQKELRPSQPSFGVQTDGSVMRSNGLSQILTLPEKNDFETFSHSIPSSWTPSDGGSTRVASPV